MDYRRLLTILEQNQVWKTVLPSINLWCIYGLLMTIIYAVFSPIILGLAGILGAILWWSQKSETKRALHEYWHSLPQFKFHGVCVLVEVAIIFYLGKTATFVINLARKNKAIN